ncbi:MAG TPA: hypothetical protein VE338_13080, partial [Ktedonobacterales bacterium]|nr:hypothetical protein [Ktedonobacterales bacterium]
MKQMPLVIGDPARQTLWIAKRPLLLMFQRARVAFTPLETISVGARNAPGAQPQDGVVMMVDTPAEQLMRRCGPVGRVLVAQSDALLRLGPRVAGCPARLRALRYVLVAPCNVYRAHDD